LRVQLALQLTVPVALALPVREAHVAPPRLLPSHCSLPFLIPSPQNSFGGMVHWPGLRVQLALQLTVPVAVASPSTDAHVAPPRSVLSHCSLPFLIPSPQGGGRHSAGRVSLPRHSSHLAQLLRQAVTGLQGRHLVGSFFVARVQEGFPLASVEPSHT
jgi:hypothetical protein